MVLHYNDWDFKNYIYKIKIYNFFCTFAVDYKEKRWPFPLCCVYNSVIYSLL